MKKYACLLSVLALCGILFAAGNPPLWKVETPQGTAYLLGSIHVAKADFYPLPDTVEAIFKRCDHLVVEMDPARVDPNALIMAGSYGNGDTLDRHVKPAIVEKLDQWCTANGMPKNTLHSLKPWMADMMVEAIIMQQKGFDANLGIDVHFLNIARQQNKPVAELEGGDEQIGFLSAIPDSLQEAMLEETFEYLPHELSEVDVMEQAWKAGDDATLRKLITEEAADPRLVPLFDILLHQRNHRMTEKLNGWLQQGGTWFVVVGDAHLLSEDGIPVLLQAKGYKVTRMGGQTEK